MRRATVALLGTLAGTALLVGAKAATRPAGGTTGLTAATGIGAPQAGATGAATALPRPGGI